MTTEERIIEIEKVMAYQTVAIDGLNEVIANQEKRIVELEDEMKGIRQRMTDERLVKPIEDEEAPPHY